MIGSLFRRLLTLIFFGAVVTLASSTALAQLESDNFTLTNDQIIPGRLGGDSTSFTVIGQNAPLVGFPESDSFSYVPIFFGDSTPSPTPTPTTDRACNESCATDSNCTGDLVCYGGRCRSTEDLTSTSCPVTSTATASPIPTAIPTSRISLAGIGEFVRELLPSQLFDIRLEIDDAIIDDIEKLVARVIFESFGTEPTPVDLTFVIEDEEGEEVYRVVGDIVVETEATFAQTFENVEQDFPAGKYTLVLTTLYNMAVEDEFRADFQIGKPLIWQSIWFWVGVGSFLALVVVGIVVKRRREKMRIFEK